MSDYKKIILGLDYSLSAATTGSVIFRDDSVIALNPQNHDHHQGNFVFRIRLAEVKDLKILVQEVNEIFNNVACVPRFHLDDYSTPSLESLYSEFENLGFKNFELSHDSVMSWSMQENESLERKLEMLDLQNVNKCREATLDDIDEVTDVVAFAFGFNSRNYDWLRHLMKVKMNMPESFQIFVTTTPHHGTDVIGAVTILFSPPGLPHLGLVNSVGTHPDHQRKGLSTQCLMYALLKTCKPSQKFYLETFDETHHAFRMYKDIGFKFEGKVKNVMISQDNDD